MDLPYSSIFSDARRNLPGTKKIREMPENAVNQELLALSLLPMTGLSTSSTQTGG
jgi:hypothetical protein